ncbi:anion exchange protein 3-like [Condylostylus longicornis]|uniref:anion exchange protein 3-like n=1 Tax=Condylostylus longicornis TaxID=2530218 RepID=UPI00244DD32F|nr:anion exchange protein 3-like [Condylostylus longicornis]XP_055373180.1 anion exchange protein 3-like [Condylostylus longicornis]
MSDNEDNDNDKDKENSETKLISTEDDGIMIKCKNNCDDIVEEITKTEENYNNEKTRKRNDIMNRDDGNDDGDDSENDESYDDIDFEVESKSQKSYDEATTLCVDENHPENGFNEMETNLERTSYNSTSREELEYGDFFEDRKHNKSNQSFKRPKKILTKSDVLKRNLNPTQFKKLPKISITPSTKRKTYDRTPHSNFVQLNELIENNDTMEWKEIARWIKYEEHIEEGSDRWGRPHVATLSFHSLLNLRQCLETCVFMLDLEENDLPAITYRIIEQLSIENQISPEEKPAIMRAMLIKHRHVNENKAGSFSFGRKKCSSYSSLQLQWLQDDNRARASISSIQGFEVQLQPKIPNRRHSYNLAEPNIKSILGNGNEINGNSRSPIDMKIEINNIGSTSIEDFKVAQNDSLLKRIPVGAEATAVLIGSVDFLNNNAVAFVRLSSGVPLPGVTEVLIPVRFIFILLGPKYTDLDYNEIGRSLATLMSNEHFLEIAYEADRRQDLINGINDFLDDSIVLPPGNWDRVDLLPFDELREKKDWIKSRKKKKLKEASEHRKKHPEEKRLEVKLTDDDLNKKLETSKGPLEKTHRCWGGLRNDLKRRLRLSMYKSDIVDGLNSETLAATVFMYFACLSTAITFGGLASEKTDDKIGISETLISASLVGIVFHAFAGQPLVIIGTTGPLLLFDQALYEFCLESKLNFLTIRAYVGFWLIIISLIVSAFEGSVYVRLLTRFTQEIFSALITLIYILETITKLYEVYCENPLLVKYSYNETNFRYDNFNETVLTTTTLLPPISSWTTDYTILNNTITIKKIKTAPISKPNTALFCTILTLGTYALASYLKEFRNSHFLGRNARRALGDFGVPIAIAVFVTIDYMKPQVKTEKLTVPDGLQPTDPSRNSWLINFEDIPNWYFGIFAGIPAILVYILIFMETHISELIVDKPERGLKKGSGLHFDIVLLCLLNALCGCLGFPWHCAATVRSVAHVSAVTVMSRTHAPGELPTVVEVKEQRLSGFFVAVLIGLSVNMAPLLRLIPMAVLFGVFLYMGVASMTGVQFFDRLWLFFMPVKHHPPVPYVKRVPTWKMHLFTGIQLSCLCVLWAVKSSRFSLAFPFFLLLLVPLRIKLASFYTEAEINALDGNQQKGEEADFYEQAVIPA